MQPWMIGCRKKLATRRGTQLLKSYPNHYYAMIIKKLLYWLVAGSRGGENRARILMLVRDKPMNVKQIADRLGLDYKTVQHHLEVLNKHLLLDSIGEGYGMAYTISPEMEAVADEIPKIFKSIKK